MLTACTGNGGAANSWGEVYNPDGTSIGSSGSSGGSSGGTDSASSGGSTAGGSSGSGSSSISAGDLLNDINSGNAGAITAHFPSGEDETAQTFFLSLSAEAFGIPEDGSMAISITGGDAPWSGTAAVVDGMLYFPDIPMVPVGADITVILTGYASNGAVVCSGYKSEHVSESGFSMEIPVLGRPVIRLGSNGTANGLTVANGTKEYEVVEYTGSELTMSVVSGNADATMTVTVNGTPVSGSSGTISSTLSDGFNEIAATVEQEGFAPVTLTKNVYVVKKLVKPVITLG
ncbi:MAG: hypothetical protein J6Y13_09500, partial [Treponema sp.]|nr:hypothetical protein [Treponema sp.]